jgi:hypothetical protein
MLFPSVTSTENGATVTDSQPDSQEADNVDLESSSSGARAQNLALCPYSKLPMKDPIKLRNCGHIFDRKSIMDLIDTKPGRGPIK